VTPVELHCTPCCLHYVMTSSHSPPNHNTVRCIFHQLYSSSSTTNLISYRDLHERHAEYHCQRTPGSIITFDSKSIDNNMVTSSKEQEKYTANTVFNNKNICSCQQFIIQPVCSEFAALRTYTFTNKHYANYYFATFTHNNIKIHDRILIPAQRQRLHLPQWQLKTFYLLHCALSIAAQCIAIGPVCGGWVVSVTTITQNCVHRFLPNLVCR